MAGSSRRVAVVFSAEIQGYRQAMKEAADATRKAKESAEDAGKSADTMLGQMVKSADTYKEEWNQVGTAVLGFGAATLAGVGMAVKTYADFDKSMSNVQAATHETAENMDLLREAAIAAGADTAFSAEEAAIGIEQLAKAGVSTKDILSGGLTGALSLAAAGELEVGEAAEFAASAMTQFGLSGDKIPHIADLLAAGAGKAQGSVQDMGAALNQVGLVANQAGLTIEETTGGLAAFASAGLTGSDAGTSFKSMLQAITPNSKAAAETMKELGISAFDANGEFIGLSEYAGVLKGALSDMSAEQRNSTLETIFGADAVRAAAVLYSEGAEGVQEWEDAVNDAGFAAETAALMQDNLAGDLEKLGGSIDTVFLKSGSGANDVLRSMAQGLEDVVDAVGSIPGPILSAGAVIAGVAGGAALLAGGLITVIPKVLETKQAFDVLVPSGGKADKALRGLGKAAGIATTAMVGLQIAKEISKAMGDGAPSIEAFSNELLKIGGGESLEGLDALVTRTEGITTEINGIGEAVAYVGSLNGFDKLGLGIGNVISLGQGLGTRMEEIIADVEGVDASIASLVESGNTEEAAASFKRIATEAAAQGMAVEDVLAIFPEYRDALIDTALEAGGTATEQEILNAALGNSDPAAVTAAAAQEVMAASLEETGVAVDGVIESMDTFLEQLFAAGLATMSSRDANVAYHDALREFDETLGTINESGGEMGAMLNKNKTDFDLTTEAGALANSTFQGLAQAGMAEVEALAKEGLGQDVLQEKLSGTYDDLVANAIAMDMDAEAAEALARKVLGVPDGVSIDTWMADTARREAENTAAAVNNIPGRKDVYINTFATTYKSIVETKGQAAGNSYVDNSGMGSLTRASGGAIFGPGSGTSDSIPALLSNGEHVLTAAEVQTMGGHQAVYSFRESLRGASVPRYASGGHVGREYMAPAAYSSGGGSVTATLAAEDRALLRAVVDRPVRVESRLAIGDRDAGRIVSRGQVANKRMGGR